VGVSRILVADDHFFLRTGLEAFLTKAGHKVIASVADGEAALEAMADRSIEVAILDFRMPRCGGLQALETLRRSGDRRPVIILAAEMDDEDLLTIFAAGANAILFKDCAEERLLAAVEQVAAGGNFMLPSTVRRIAMSGATGRPAATAGGPFARLSEREGAIVQLVARGLRNREIAQALDTTEGTIKAYLHGIYRKLGIENRASLAALATEVLAQKA
jgi:two-component system, NarL family, nitrate/nitrite response regulator NarL